LFSRQHPDYAKFFMLSTIYGGYFGSRLMKKVREEKGYTYNIYAGLDLMKHHGYFYINTETDNKHCEKTIEAIYDEMDLLKNEPVSKEELKMVKNYIMGSFLNMLDGPMNSGRLLQTMILSGQNYQDFLGFVDQIQSMNSKDLQDTANKYFIKKDFLEIVVIDN